MENLTYLAFAPILEQNPSGLPRRFSGVAYSGGVIPQYGWYGQAAIDLETLSVPESAIFALVDHEPSRRAGKLTASVRDGALHIDGEFFASTDAGKEVAALFAEGAPWQLSVGIQADVSTSDDLIPVALNGRTLEVNSVFRNAALREVSFVPVGADPATSVAAFSPLNRTHRMSDSQTEIEGLKKSLAEMTARAEAAEALLAEIKAAARQEAITQLSADLGRQFTEQQVIGLAEMPDAMFGLTVEMMRTLKPAPAPAPEHLFQHQAVNGAEPAQGPKLVDLNAKLLSQVAGR